MIKKEKLQLIIENGTNLLDNRKGKDSPEFSAWNSTLIRFMETEFGIDNTDTKRLQEREYYPRVFAIGADNNEYIYKKYRSDLEKTIYELKSIFDDYDDIVINKKSKNDENNLNSNVPNITLNVNNSSNNSNINNISITFENIVESINNDKNISSENKDDIIKSINEIKNIYDNNKLSQKDKWMKIKGILSFLLDKGVDFVITYLPYIIISIKNLGGM